MKVRLLFFFSFVLASAALVQHGDKLPLSNNVEGSENSCCCIMRFVEKSFSFFVIFIIIIFMATFLLLKVYKFNHTMLVLNACISSHFRGLKFKTFRGTMPRTPPNWLTLTCSKRAPQLQTCRAIQYKTTKAWWALSHRLHFIRFFFRHRIIIIHCVLILLLLESRQHLLNENRESQRRFWVRPILKARKAYRCYHSLVQELRVGIEE